MKLRLVVVTLAMLLLALSFTLFAPGKASAQVKADDCTHAATIDSLEMCVQHAADQGHIDSQKVAHSLLVKLDKAEAALANDHPKVAIGWLNAFIHEVKAQSGKHIEAMHAEQLVMHAKMVIAALEKDE